MKTMDRTRDQASSVGEGHITLAVSDPRELAKNQKFKRGDVVSVGHTYPLMLLVPEHASWSSCRWIFPINYGGGLVEGDVMTTDINVGASCIALVTTQEFTKVYSCHGGETSRQHFTYKVDENAFLAVLGDPVVCHADSRYMQTQKVYMSSKSSLVFLDWLTAGRVALGEMWQFHSYQSVVEVHVDDELVFRDNHLLTNTPHLSLKAAMKDYQVLGMCVVLGEDVQCLTDHLKSLYDRPCTIGSHLRTDLICSFSPLTAEVKNGTLHGCYVRFLAKSTTLAFSVVKEVSNKLKHFLGGDPFDKKY